MDFLILGPLEVRTDGGAPLALAGGQPRTLLALLLLHPNQPVSTDRIATALWGEDAPAETLRAVRVVVSRLRRVFEDGQLESSAAGYCLRVAPGELDSERFAALVGDAAEAQDPATAASTLRDALSLWRGRPLADVEFAGFAQAAVAGLQEQRLAAVESLMDAELELGRERAVVAELQQLVTQHPLRERLQGQLMLALYRSGRQAEALDAYRRFRADLDEELGLQPSAELRQLEEAILRQEPSLDASPVAPAPVVAPARRRSRRVPVLLAVGTIAGVVTGMLAIGDPADQQAGSAASLGTRTPTAEAIATAAGPDFADGVVDVCERINAAFRVHRRDTSALARQLRRATTTTQQRRAILTATRRSAARGSRNLAMLRALEPSESSRVVYTRTTRTWDANLQEIREYAKRVDQAPNRRGLRAAIAPYTAARPTLERNFETVTAGLRQMGGPDCEIDVYVPQPVFLPDLKEGKSVEPQPQGSLETGGGATGTPPGSGSGSTGGSVETGGGGAGGGGGGDVGGGGLSGGGDG